MTNFAIANTDLDWFGQLRNDGYEQSPVNFWTLPLGILKIYKRETNYFLCLNPRYEKLVGMVIS